MWCEPDYGEEEKIIRRYKVMLSAHLAEQYEVEPRTFMQAVKRKTERFPSDFMFRLSREEFSALRSQIVILKRGGGDAQFKLVSDAIHELMAPPGGKKNADRFPFIMKPARIPILCEQGKSRIVTAWPFRLNSLSLMGHGFDLVS